MASVIETIFALRLPSSLLLPFSCFFSFQSPVSGSWLKSCSMRSSKIKRPSLMPSSCLSRSRPSSSCICSVAFQSFTLTSLYFLVIADYDAFSRALRPEVISYPRASNAQLLLLYLASTREILYSQTIGSKLLRTRRNCSGSSKVWLSGCRAKEMSTSTALASNRTAYSSSCYSSNILTKQQIRSMSSVRILMQVTRSCCSMCDCKAMKVCSRDGIMFLFTATSFWVTCCDPSLTCSSYTR